jgi:hypothetical protein
MPGAVSVLLQIEKGRRPRTAGGLSGPPSLQLGRGQFSRPLAERMEVGSTTPSPPPTVCSTVKQAGDLNRKIAKRRQNDYEYGHAQQGYRSVPMRHERKHAIARVYVETADIECY